MSKNLEKITFGSEKWMEELNKRVSFPQMFVMYYGVDKKTKESYLFSEILNTTSKNPNNVKYGLIRPSLGMSLTSVNWSIIGVYYIETDKEYMEKVKEISDKWKIDLT